MGDDRALIRLPPSPRPRGGTAWRWFLTISILAHVLPAGVALLWWWPAPSPPAGEAPATIAVLFGDNADVAGAPARTAPAASAPAAAPSAAAQAAGQDGAVAPAAASPGAASPSVPFPPVRLGEGDIGLKLTDPPDPGLIEAQADPGNRAPKFPDLAYSQHQYGRVILRMHVDPQGRVATIEVLESSGHPALDRAAREALAKWHFIPALRDGVAVPSFRDQAINFVPE